MRVLVIGGAGYIGSHTALELAKRGHSVVLFDNLSAGHASFAGQIPLLPSDIQDSRALKSALKNIDAVFHFAALAYVGESVLQPRKYFETNVNGGLAVLNATLDAGIRYFIFSSSCAVYGNPASIPIREDTPRSPVNPYGASKLFMEHALEAYGRAHGLNSVSLRYFNAAGADASGEIGELHDPETHLIPSAIEAALGIRPELEVFGDDYPTPDGTCIRDYVHVTDLAVAHADSLDYLTQGGETAAINLGTGKGHSIQEIIHEVEIETKRKVPVRILPRRPGDPPVLIADCSKAKELFQWTPRHTLRQIIRTATAWIANGKARIREPELFRAAGHD